MEKLITPQMRQQIIEVTKRLEGYAGCLGEFFHDVNDLNTFETVLGMADDLRYREPLETLEMRKKREQEEAADDEDF